MSLQANFAEWCRLRGYKPTTAVYLEDGLGGLKAGQARLVRMVRAAKRVGKRQPQKYVVEVFLEDELHYPFTTKGLTREQLLRKLISATMERSA